MNKKILRLAIPNIISNISVPLAGMIDLALVGYLKNDAVNYVSAIALGGMIFNFLYMSFVFLRMTTTGFTAQSYGKRDFSDSITTLSRSIFIALAAGLCIIILQIPIANLAFSLIKTEPEIKILVQQYFYIRVWAAPATIGLYSILGWFIGMQNARSPMLISILVNVLNLALSALFILGFGMKSDGVALGTMIAQYCGFILAVFILVKYYGKLFKYWSLEQMKRIKELFAFFNVSKDILIRTLCIIGVFTFITSQSAAINKETLAVNSLLLQFLLFFSYMIDGFAYAAEALVGRYVGANDKSSLRKCVNRLLIWGSVLAMMFGLTYLIFRENILYVLTNDTSIIELAKEYIFWTIILPFVAFGAFLWDGIYIGATASSSMRNAMIISTLGVFTPTYYVSYQYIGNHGLWLALCLFMLSRGLLLHFMSSKSIFNISNN